MLIYFLFILLININHAFIPNLLNLKLKVIEYSSNILPKVDVFGHKILEENKLLIEKIIHMDSLSIELKKELILTIIKFTEVGDSFGNFVLTNYEHLVNNLL
tara:strand:- start:614 stop:919 length:306 start_codon:yes stop_codon:yes gene_type:complete